MWCCRSHTLKAIGATVSHYDTAQYHSEIVFLVLILCYV